MSTDNKPEPQDALPPLPEPRFAAWADSPGNPIPVVTSGYTADQMHDYARLALSTPPIEGAQAAQALDVGAAGFTLTRSILYKCPALKLPQEWWQKLGDMSQIVPLRGVTDEMAAEIVRRLNAATTPAPAVTPQVVQQPLTGDQLDALRQQDNGALNFVTLRQFRVVARAVEAKHGIGTPAEPELDTPP